MDFFFEDLPSTSQSTSKSGLEALEMTDDADFNSTSGMPSRVSSTEVHDQQISSTIDAISRRVQDLVEQINHGRDSDQKVIESFQEKLMDKMTEVCQQMKDNMYAVYEENSKEMQVKLQELTGVLESCTKLHKELMEASQALSGLREGLAMTQVPEP